MTIKELEEQVAALTTRMDVMSTNLQDRLDVISTNLQDLLRDRETDNAILQNVLALLRARPEQHHLNPPLQRREDDWSDSPPLQRRENDWSAGPPLQRHEDDWSDGPWSAGPVIRGGNLRVDFPKLDDTYWDQEPYKEEGRRIKESLSIEQVEEGGGGGGGGAASIYFSVVRFRLPCAWHLVVDSETPPPTKGSNGRGGGIEEDVVVVPSVFVDPSDRSFSGIASVGPTIYVLGGQERRHGHFIPPFLSDVYYINTLCPDLGWKKLDHSMNYPRWEPHAVTLEGKIYVMGGNLGWEKGIRCSRPEVFDTNEEERGWHVLCGSEYLHGWIQGHALLDGGKRILVHSPCQEGLYCYDVEADSWEVYSKELGKYKDTSAFVDGILYYKDYKQPSVLFGLDVSKPDNLPKKVRVLQGDKDPDFVWIPQPHPSDDDAPTTFLVSIGGAKLAAIWSCGAGPNVMRVYCSKFKMCKVKGAERGEVEFVARPLSRSDMCVEGNGMIAGCLAV